MSPPYLCVSQRVFATNEVVSVAAWPRSAAYGDRTPKSDSIDVVDKLLMLSLVSRPRVEKVDRGHWDHFA